MLVGAIVDGAAEVVNVGVGTPVPAVGVVSDVGALDGAPSLFVWALVGVPVVGAIVGARDGITAGEEVGLFDGASDEGLDVVGPIDDDDGTAVVGALVGAFVVLEGVVLLLGVLVVGPVVPAVL